MKKKLNLSFIFSLVIYLCLLGQQVSAQCTPGLLLQYDPVGSNITAGPPFLTIAPGFLDPAIVASDLSGPLMENAGSNTDVLPVGPMPTSTSPDLARYISPLK